MKHDIKPGPAFGKPAPRAIDPNVMALEACRELVETIEATGGIVYPECGLPYPAADPTWIDLVDPYVKAKYVVEMTR